MKTYKWDMADNINTKDDVYAYLEAAIEENDTETLYDVIGAIARSKGMTAIAMVTRWWQLPESPNVVRCNGTLYRA